MKIELLTLVEPNKNHRSYSPVCIQSALDKLKDNKAPLFAKMPDNYSNQYNLHNLVGEVHDLEVCGKSLYGTVNILPAFDSFNSILHSGMSIRPIMYGCVDEDGVVTDIDINGFAFTDDPA